jgi:hypothetical protein
MHYYSHRRSENGVKPILVTSAEIRTIFLPKIKEHARENGYCLNFGMFIFNYTDINYRHGGRYVRGKGLLFKILDREGRQHIWNFPRAEMMPILEKHLRKNFTVNGNFDPLIEMSTDGLVVWLPYGQRKIR